MGNKEISTIANFEVLDSNEENAIFKRIVKARGRTSKEINTIEKSLPKTTIHFISEDEYRKLKEIEVILIDEFQSTKRERNTISEIRKHIFKFLEI
jgi:hypothetical protein